MDERNRLRASLHVRGKSFKIKDLEVSIWELCWIDDHKEVPGCPKKDYIL